MGKVVVSFVVTVIVDQDDEKEAGVDLDKKLTGILAKMEDIAAREFEIYDSNIETEDY